MNSIFFQKKKKNVMSKKQVQDAAETDLLKWKKGGNTDREGDPRTLKTHSQDGSRHVCLPLGDTVYHVEFVFFAGGWHPCAGSRASLQNSSCVCRAALLSLPWRVGDVHVRSLCEALSLCWIRRATRVPLSVTRHASQRFLPRVRGKRVNELV